MRQVFRVFRFTLIAIAALVLAACSGSTTSSTPAAGISPAASTSVAKPAITTTPNPPAVSSAAPVSSPAPNTATPAAKTTAAASSGELTDIVGKMTGFTAAKYDSTISGSSVPSITQKIYLKKNRMRADSTVNGMSFIMLVDTDKQTIYQYQPAQNTATKMDFSKSPKPVTDAVKTLMNNNPIIIGTETVDGKVCLVIQYTSATEGTVKMWLWKDRGFPVKMETTASTGGTITVLNTNFDFSDIPDSTFDLPANVKITDLGGVSNLPPGMPSLPPGYTLPTGMPALPPGYTIPARTP